MIFKYILFDGVLVLAEGSFRNKKQNSKKIDLNLDR